MHGLPTTLEIEPALILPPDFSLLSQFTVGDMQLFYLQDAKTDVTGLLLIPATTVDFVKEHRLSDNGKKAWNLDSLVHLKLLGDNYPSLFCQGRTMRNSESTGKLRFLQQTVEADEELGTTTVITLLQHESNCQCEHRLSWRNNENFLEVSTVFHNKGETACTLEMLSSFSLGGITPFSSDDASERLLVHRLRSAWCAEGRLETRPIEELQLECFNYPDTATVERFGQVGSMPVRGWHPFVALEDREEGVLWGAQLACPGSWQIEVYRRDDLLSISGGVADRETGHWLKSLEPGERFTTPTAILTTTTGTIDDLCDRMKERQERRTLKVGEIDLPIVFNDWCCHWGDTSHAKVAAMAAKLKGSGVRYFVIDAGWSSLEGGWETRTDRFPYGMEAVAAEIRRNGMIPGLWFEIEVCRPESADTNIRRPHVLHRDGMPIQVGKRWFWDFRDPWVVEHLSKCVIDLLERGGFGYLKVDYNDSIGIGCDGAESLGEGLRQHLEGVQQFWSLIRKRLPHLIIENCSSGGHRLEPSMFELSDVSSFSDAHEIEDIPIVAANVERILLPRQSQIWAVLRKGDDERRLYYTLSATLLGRMGLSGDILDLDSAQHSILQEGIAFYQQAVPVIRNGVSRRDGSAILSYRNPKGWQTVVRHNVNLVLVVCHAFEGIVPHLLEIKLPDGKWKLKSSFPSKIKGTCMRDGILYCPIIGPGSGCAILLEASGMT